MTTRTFDNHNLFPANYDKVFVQIYHEELQVDIVSIQCYIHYSVGGPVYSFPSNHGATEARLSAGPRRL